MMTLKLVNTTSFPQTASVESSILLKGPNNAIEKVLDTSSDLLITAESDAKGTVFLTLKTSCTVHVTVHDGADIAVICLQSGANAIIKQRSTIGVDASLRWHNITVGEQVTQDLISTVTGNGGKSDIDWIFRIRGKNKHTISARNVFAAHDGGGEITLKGVASDTAYAECNGMIEITEEGRGTNTYLTEDVLMLDPTAKVDAIPALEIRTNDVKASHSATVSRVTAEDLFFFQSRGIDAAKARTMFIDGFLGDLISRITSLRIRTAVLEAL